MARSCKSPTTGRSLAPVRKIFYNLTITSFVDHFWSPDDALTKQALGLGQKLNNAYRNLQRTLSASLAPTDFPTRQINGASRPDTPNNPPARRTGQL